jgi:hypothetical protein
MHTWDGLRKTWFEPFSSPHDYPLLLSVFWILPSFSATSLRAIIWPTFCCTRRTQFWSALSACAWVCASRGSVRWCFCSIPKRAIGGMDHGNEEHLIHALHACRLHGLGRWPRRGIAEIGRAAVGQTARHALQDIAIATADEACDAAHGVAIVRLLCGPRGVFHPS